MNQIDNQVNSEYQELKSLIIDLYDERVWFMTDTALSVAVACLLRDIANPIALIFVDGPSTGKTTVLDFFSGAPSTFRVDKFTPASFLTQSGKVDARNLSKVDLLPHLPYKTLLIPEMAPLFSQPKELLLVSYATLARVLDGSGLSSAGGVHGRRELTGDYIFNMLGASTPLNKTAWNTMGKVGSRLLFLNAAGRGTKQTRRERALSLLQAQVDYRTKKLQARNAVGEFLSHVLNSVPLGGYELPEDLPEHISGKSGLIEHAGYCPRSVEWDRSSDDFHTLEVRALLSEFTTCVRQDVLFWNDDKERAAIESTPVTGVEEGVDRFTSLVYGLARGHAIINGRRCINLDDLAIPLNCALSSLPDDRRKAVELLVDPGMLWKKSSVGTFSISELATTLGCGDSKARSVMQKLNTIGLGIRRASQGPGEAVFEIDKQYTWFASEEFQSYFRPWDRVYRGGENFSKNPTYV